jgi:hypothetical protein
MGAEGQSTGAGGLRRRSAPGQMGTSSLSETSSRGRRLISAPAGVGKASGEDCCVAASSLTRWGGCAAVLGGVSTAFVGGFFPPHHSKSKGE